jgi:hypothetical protein
MELRRKSRVGDGPHAEIDLPALYHLRQAGTTGYNNLCLGQILLAGFDLTFHGRFCSDH